MAKETDSVTGTKRKPDGSETANGGSEVKQIKSDLEEKKQSVVGIYQRVTAFEEKEALERDPDTDLEQFRTFCKEFAEHISQIHNLIATKPDEWADDVKERKMEVGLLTVFMKKLNRIEKIRNRNAREHVTKVRQQVDVLQLQLQNLMCEIQHLSREVDKCLRFKSKPLGVDLVPVEEFFNEAPPEISRPEITKSDDHQLLLARLEWELKQRKELSILCSQLDDKKKSVSFLINKKQSDLDSLAPHIKEVLTVTKPLQEKLGYSAGPTSLKSDLASLLPHCLYFLYIQAAAYRDASDDIITIEINGNEDLAREAMKQPTCNGEKDNTSSVGDSDNDDSEKALKKDNSDKIENKSKRLLEKHPLSVILKFFFKDDSCLSLEFTYLLKLNIMTVIPSLNLTNGQLKGSEAGEFLQDRNILCNLFAGDVGTESPNVSNFYQLHELNLQSLDTKKLGFPYIWVQKIGGLDFTPGSSTNDLVEPKLDMSKTSIPIVIKLIRKRVRSRIVLIKQIIALENKNVLGPPAMKTVKLSCGIKSWKSISWDEFRDHSASAHFRDTEYVSPHDIFFSAAVLRGKAKLTVLTVVKCDYPMAPPLYALQIELNDVVLNASNSQKIRDMESEVNVYWKELVEDTTWASTLLMYQIHRIMVNFDIFLECNDPSKFNAEKKTFLHRHRGRGRFHPFKYSQLGDGLFLQR